MNFILIFGGVFLVLIFSLVAYWYFFGKSKNFYLFKNAGYGFLENFVSNSGISILDKKKGDGILNKKDPNSRYNLSSKDLKDLPEEEEVSVGGDGEEGLTPKGKPVLGDDFSELSKARKSSGEKLLQKELKKSSKKGKEEGQGEGGEGEGKGKGKGKEAKVNVGKEEGTGGKVGLKREIHINTFDEIVKNVEQKNIKDILLFLKTKTTFFEKKANLNHIFNSKKDFNTFVNEEILTFLEDELTVLKTNISEYRKKGKKVNSVNIVAMKIPLKINFFKVTWMKKDFDKVVFLLNLAKNELSKLGPLEEKKPEVKKVKREESHSKDVNDKKVVFKKTNVAKPTLKKSVKPVTLKKIVNRKNKIKK